MVARADTRTNFLLSSGNFSGSELFSTRFTCSSNLQKISSQANYKGDEEKPVVVHGGAWLWCSFLLFWLGVLLLLLFFKVLGIE